MAFLNSDRYLWITIGLGLGIAYYSIPQILQRVRSETFVLEDPDGFKRESEGLRQGAEDAQKIDTLRALAAGHSLELRNAAIKIVAARSIKPKVRRLLLHDLASKDEDRRDNAINGLWLLLYHTALHEKHFPVYFMDRKGFSALITALVNVLPQHDRPINPQAPVGYDQKYGESKLPPSPLRPPNRPAHEVSLLIILHLLLIYKKPPGPDDPDASPNNVDIALSAGMITRWLSHYPFPCALPENAGLNYQKSDVTSLFERKAWASDDPLMYEIMSNILLSKNGRKQLLNAGLRKRMQGEEQDKPANTPPGPGENGVWVDRDVSMVGGETTAGHRRNYDEVWDELTAAQAQDLPRPRSRQRSHEEEMLHRRRRETVVIAEPGAPISRDNIHEPIRSPVTNVPVLTFNNEDEREPIHPPQTLNSSGLSNDLEPQFSITSQELRRMQATERPFRHRIRDRNTEGHVEYVDDGPIFMSDPDDVNDLGRFMQDLTRADRDRDFADIREIMRRANYSPEQLSMFLSGVERAEDQPESSARRRRP